MALLVIDSVILMSMGSTGANRRHIGIEAPSAHVGWLAWSLLLLHGRGEARRREGCHLSQTHLVDWGSWHRIIVIKRRIWSSSRWLPYLTIL